MVGQTTAVPRYYSAADLDPSLIQSKRVAVLGYGNQGHAHALNLRDSGVEVVIGGREGGKSWKAAEEAGFAPVPVSHAVSRADVIMLTLPDVEMAHIYRQHIGPHLREGQLLLFAHGFNIHFGLIQPPKNMDVAMVSPKGPGHGLRSEFLQDSGLPALVAVNQDASGNAERLALSYAWGIGCGRTLLLQTTFAEETVCDLFGEQAVLCGGMIELVKAGFETLVAAGYEPEAAYFECLHETKLIVDLLVTRGLAGLRAAISDTAEWGGYISGPRVVNEESRAAMKSILSEIESGAFAAQFVMEVESGCKRFNEYRAAEAEHPAEPVGREMRERMPFLKRWMKG